MEVKDRIRERRQELGLTLEQVGNFVGVSKSTVKKWESGLISNMRRDKIAKLSEVLRISPVELMGWEEQVQPAPTPAPETHASNLLPFPEMPLVPIVGRVACGQPITAEENIEGYTGLPAEWHADFILICEGASMEPRIMDGDAVAIRKVEEVHNGQIAAVRIGDEATLKKVYRYADRLELRPINPDYDSIVLYREEMNTAAIEGRAVGLCRGI